jgi:CubicO group peptidase (beta-lactamase class C family)
MHGLLFRPLPFFRYGRVRRNDNSCSRAILAGNLFAGRLFHRPATVADRTSLFRRHFVPGTKQRYSGGGFTILQQLMIDVTGKPFPQIMQNLVLDKLGLQDSTYEQPLPPSRAASAGSGLNLHGGGPAPGNVSPEMAVAGAMDYPLRFGEDRYRGRTLETSESKPRSLGGHDSRDA